MKKHPSQPLELDDDGALRFKQNAIVRFLLDAGPFDLNQIAMMQVFSREDREQFAQLIGYSLNGFTELNYVSEEVMEAARNMHEDEEGELVARYNAVVEKLEDVQGLLRDGVARLYGIHPDDLNDGIP